MKHSIPRLPDGELEVMQALWDCTPPASRTDIEAVLLPVHQLAPTTLLTILSRLAEKGFLAVEKEGRRSLYTPLVEKSDYLAAQSGSFIRKLCRGSMSTFAAALCDSGISKEDLEELSQLLKKGEL